MRSTSTWRHDVLCTRYLKRRHCSPVNHIFIDSSLVQILESNTQRESVTSVFLLFHAGFHRFLKWETQMYRVIFWKPLQLLAVAILIRMREEYVQKVCVTWRSPNDTGSFLRWFLPCEKQKRLPVLFSMIFVSRGYPWWPYSICCFRFKIRVLWPRDFR